MHAFIVQQLGRRMRLGKGGNLPSQILGDSTIEGTPIQKLVNGSKIIVQNRKNKFVKKFVKKKFVNEIRKKIRKKNL